MKIRVVVADERQADFFDAFGPSVPLQPCGSLRNGDGQHAGQHSGTADERSTERHDLTVFANEVARLIDVDRERHAFDRLAIVAGPRVLGLLRQALPHSFRNVFTVEVRKDLRAHSPEEVRNALPRSMFTELG
jgi:protein required for attachment to host cells